MGFSYTRIDLESLKRAEVAKIAKSLLIKANGKVRSFGKKEKVSGMNFWSAKMKGPRVLNRF